VQPKLARMPDPRAVQLAVTQWSDST
jgi:hypothetical protein